MSLRNGFAHNTNLTSSEIIRRLEYLCEVLVQFDLRRHDATSALERVKLLFASDGLIRCELKEHGQKDEDSVHARILRPSVGHFVGRQREITLIKDRLCILDMAISKVVIIDGAAGIGKTYLAHKVIRELSCIYERQTWICCSREENFHQDLSSTLQKNSIKKEAKLSNKGKLPGKYTVKKQTFKLPLLWLTSGWFSWTMFVLRRCSMLMS